MVKWHIFLLAFLIGGITYQDNPLSTSTCVTPPAEDVTFDTSAGYAEGIQNYLSAGGDPNRLKPMLQAGNLIPTSDATNGVFVLDLTGDSKEDLIVNIAYPIQESDVKHFVIWVYICDGKDYRRMYAVSYAQVSPALDRGGYVDMVQDLNNDSYPEIIHRSVSCGVNTCYESLGITGWNDTMNKMHTELFDNFLLGDYEFTDPDGDGIFDVVITSGVSGSAGAGPQRRWQTTYGWDGVNFTQRRNVPEAPRFAFEAAQDAAIALNAGDLQSAAILYQRILYDPTLSGIDRQTDAIMRTQALFGLLVIRMVQRDSETAAEIYAELQNEPGIPASFSTPKTYTESLWVQVGRIFYPLAQKYRFDEACDAVLIELNHALKSERESPGLRTTYWGNFGSRPRPEAICPF
jgi:hypothetical protein